MSPMSSVSAPRVLVSGVVLGQAMGGVRRHAAEVLPRAARLLAERGGDLAVLEGAQPVPFELPASVRRLAFDIPFQPVWRRGLAEGRAARGAAAGFDLWHTGHLPLPRPGIPVALFLHDLRDVQLPETPTLRRVLAPRVLRAALRAASVVITPSQSVKDELVARFDTRDVEVVPHGSDHLEVLPRGEPGPLLCVGHVERRKNLELLLRALAHDPGLPDLLVVGAPKADEEARLGALAAELGVADRVTFEGPVPDERLPALYASAACVVIPSRLEGFGLGVLEAQRARVPLAIADAGALPEVAGADVPLFPTEDPAAAAAAIRAALGSPPELLERCARRASAHTWDASAGGLVDAWYRAAGS
jgi:glycosyltransferase involved in cell wall biosynthesis